MSEATLATGRASNANDAAGGRTRRDMRPRRSAGRSMRTLVRPEETFPDGVEPGLLHQRVCGDQRTTSRDEGEQPPQVGDVRDRPPRYVEPRDVEQRREETLMLEPLPEQALLLVARENPREGRKSHESDDGRVDHPDGSQAEGRARKRVSKAAMPTQTASRPHRSPSFGTTKTACIRVVNTAGTATQATAMTTKSAVGRRAGRRAAPVPRSAADPASRLSIPTGS